MLVDTTEIQFQTLAQFSQGGEWYRQLAHDLDCHVLIWVTRGQGRVLLDGIRRGIGAHNALFVPAGALFSMDLGRQSIGHVVLLPVATDLRLPEIPRHLRIREVQAQSELTGLIESGLREDQGHRPLRQDALEGHASLMSVWLRRQILDEIHTLERRTAAQRLSGRFCTMVSQHYRSGEAMSVYAKTLGVTPTHLTRAIKAATGKTAADILTERVLHDARRLLAETSHPAKQIAASLGFGSAAYFTRFIQQHTGQSPSNLRGKSERPQ
ncbi:helix-turn-helix domain-containing protein [Sulfitobacter sp. M57]|nr:MULTISPECIES: AraC family transcriptional regulator [unclassified Sulfitobacter]MDF3413639.1 helix-turn-helix domain-containing protein [Sulfitobacter sp. KE5]MDF3421080.1 helix-turn-helix domain-containing protein [Sulfitobacter sp. KE43]MDF3432185.1 helix-turn-helix domain-containing protein [Sulfitobacter sp. KE42]MDF3457824.1 helix-turn-helix domain-containing protein [Sulfitobacter sp. S74]MDF3461725.1 helix-turn-helix domain-containing protein [Sulfitobacter sp. Ks18]